MKRVVIKDSLELFSRELNVKQVALTAEDYKARVGLLRERMKKDKIDVAFVYGDREHFSNIEYLSAYDCRFEEGILVIPQNGVPTLLCGNEGMSYSYVVPYDIRREYYRNLSLQGQPRKASEKLDALLKGAGINETSRVGVIGFKYFLEEYSPTDPKYTFDIPHYMLEALRSVAAKENIVNYTAVMTGLEGGIRLKVYSAREIAAAEAAAARSANGLLGMLKSLRPGITEYEVGQSARLGVAPVTMFSLTNFGPEHLSLGLRSPDDVTKLALGEVCGLCYSVRGSLSSRVGVAAYNMDTCEDALKPCIDDFYAKFYLALCSWYEKLRVGADGNALHHAVHDIIGGDEFGVTLNCGHYTGMDEWVNSLSYDGSKYTLPDGAYLQTDIIASGSNPVRTAICEDPVIVAGAELRQELAREYPEVYARINERRNAIMSHLNIALSDDVLPLSNVNAAMFPFMLNLNKVFALQEA